MGPLMGAGARIEVLGASSLVLGAVDLRVWVLADGISDRE